MRNRVNISEKKRKEKKRIERLRKTYKKVGCGEE